jgi:crotonobetainyl-CoA:carnitine CoA-transferase CaiB-like acyl-CoA transferase
MQHGKRDKQKVSALLDKALPAAYERLRQGKPVLVHNSQSLAVASFLCMAILLRHFDGAHPPPTSSPTAFAPRANAVRTHTRHDIGATWEALQERPASPVTKPRIQKALLFVAAQVPQGKGPSRALMKVLTHTHAHTSADNGA